MFLLLESQRLHLDVQPEFYNLLINSVPVQKLTPGIYGQISKSGFLPVNETVFYGKLPRIDDLPVIHFESRGTVDKNREECLIFVYRLVQIQGARPRK